MFCAPRCLNSKAMPPPNKKPAKKRVYKSAETRARQLAGLAGVRIADHVMGADHIQKVNGQGNWASVSEETRKQILELYSSGYTIVAIAEKLGLSKTVVGDVKLRALDTDTQFANAMFKVNIRQKLQRSAETSADRIAELMPEMEARDAILAMSKSMEILLEMDKDKAPEINNTMNLHIHASDLQAQFMAAMADQPKTIDV